MKREELEVILAAHAAWLAGEAGGVRADLRGANLISADLREADLRGANLISADLREADLRGADLRYADLRGADLRDANLGYANLGYANLGYANLISADLREADLRHADLRRAELRDAELGDADLRGAVGNGREILTMQTGTYHVARTATDMAIGCEQHPIEEWWGFDDERIDAMDVGALEWWRVWKPILKQWIEAAP